VRFVNLRIESSIKNILEQISQKSGVPISDIIRDVVWIGIGFKELGGIIITGPFGLHLPFAQINFGPKDARINIYLEEEQYEYVVRTFQKNNYNAIGEALKLGLASLDYDSFSITGMFGAPRPLTSVKLPELRNPKAIEAFKRVKEFIA